MNADSRLLSGDKITDALKTEAFGRNLVILGETASTNTLAKELAASGAVHGTAVIADSQTAGRGRLGRSFVSPEGCGIYMSVIIRPRFSLETAQLITSCAACAAAEAVESLCDENVAVKWVKDLYIGGRKICGILTEASINGRNSSLEYAVIGIGINVLSAENAFDDELKAIATSIEAETGVKLNRNILCAELLNRLEEHLENIESREYLKEYRRREMLTGHIITANADGSAVIGRAVGIDDNACLLIELEDGKIKTVNSGEANRCRIKE